MYYIDRFCIYYNIYSTNKNIYYFPYPACSLASLIKMVFGTSVCGSHILRVFSTTRKFSARVLKLMTPTILGLDHRMILPLARAWVSTRSSFASSLHRPFKDPSPSGYSWSLDPCAGRSIAGPTDSGQTLCFSNFSSQMLRKRGWTTTGCQMAAIRPLMLQLEAGQSWIGARVELVHMADRDQTLHSTCA